MPLIIGLYVTFLYATNYWLVWEILCMPLIVGLYVTFLYATNFIIGLYVIFLYATNQGSPYQAVTGKICRL